MDSSTKTLTVRNIWPTAGNSAATRNSKTRIRRKCCCSTSTIWLGNWRRAKKSSWYRRRQDESTILRGDSRGRSRKGGCSAQRRRRTAGCQGRERSGRVHRRQVLGPKRYRHNAARKGRGTRYIRGLHGGCPGTS